MLLLVRCCNAPPPKIGRFAACAGQNDELRLSDLNSFKRFQAFTKSEELGLWHDHSNK